MKSVKPSASIQIVAQQGAVVDVVLAMATVIARELVRAVIEAARGAAR